MHSRGQGFESPNLHQSGKKKTHPQVHAGGVVTIAKGKHPFPSRTRPLSPSAPTILGGQPPGKIGRCHSTRLHRRDFYAQPYFFSLSHFQQLRLHPVPSTASAPAKSVPSVSSWSDQQVIS